MPVIFIDYTSPEAHRYQQEALRMRNPSMYYEFVINNQEGGKPLFTIYMSPHDTFSDVYYYLKLLRHPPDHLKSRFKLKYHHVIVENFDTPVSIGANNEDGERNIDIIDINPKMKLVKLIDHVETNYPMYLAVGQSLQLKEILKLYSRVFDEYLDILHIQGLEDLEKTIGESIYEDESELLVFRDLLDEAPMFQDHDYEEDINMIDDEADMDGQLSTGRFVVAAAPDEIEELIGPESEENSESEEDPDYEYGLVKSKPKGIGRPRSIGTPATVSKSRSTTLIRDPYTSINTSLHADQAQYVEKIPQRTTERIPGIRRPGRKRLSSSTDPSYSLSKSSQGSNDGTAPKKRRGRPPGAKNKKKRYS